MDAQQLAHLLELDPASIAGGRDGLYVARRADGSSLAIAVERVPPTGRAGFEGALARGLLRVRACARLQPAWPCVVLLARRFTPAMEKALRSFLAPHVTPFTPARWIATDGRRVLGPIAERRDVPGEVMVAEPARARPPRAPGLTGYSDAFLVAVKSLALARLPARYRTHVGPRLEMGPGISRAQMHRFRTTYARLGFVAPSHDGRLELRDRRRLFDGWGVAIAAQYGDVVHVRVPGGLESWARARAASPGPRWALTAHAAAEHWDLNSGVAGAPLTIYVEGDPRDAATALDLPLADSHAPFDALLVSPRYPRAVWSCMKPADGTRLPLVDVVQVYLDLLRHPYRGQESAEYVARSLPALLGDER